MRKLYQKIYLTMIAALLLVVLVAGTLWRLGSANSPLHQALEMAGELLGATLPPATAPREVQRQALDQLARRVHADLGLFDATSRPIAFSGRPVPPPFPDSDGGWIYGPGGPAWSFRLPDLRWVVVRAPRRHRNPAVGLVLFLGLIALAVAACAFPVVRSLTRRLETLQAGVETLGAGNLSTRVKVEGRDEVARLAESFNRAAARIEELVGAHRMLLANASHELRTPLSRIRLGIELMEARPDPKYAAELKRDIAELDGLIDEILLASRIDAIRTPAAEEEVDLLALAAEECARYDDCDLQGEPVTLRGDPRLLRRMIRNLLENAEQHGKPPVTVTLKRAGNESVIEVTDGGPGIPPSQREHVFAPFYRLAGDPKGAGLGLSLVRQIARLHGGDAVAAPKPEAPSSFRVMLPIAPLD
ncbi:MAG: HAMP domain-containing sensor histidine kinase [Xanthobacteraceae bacterium]